MITNLSNLRFTDNVKTVNLKKNRQLYCCVCKQPIISCINGYAYCSFGDDDVTCSRCLSYYEETTRADCLNDLIKDDIPNWQEPIEQDTTNRVLVRLEKCY